MVLLTSLFTLFLYLNAFSNLQSKQWHQVVLIFVLYQSLHLCFVSSLYQSNHCSQTTICQDKEVREHLQLLFLSSQFMFLAVIVHLHRCMFSM